MTDEQDKAFQQIVEYVNQINALIDKATALADEHGVGFTLDHIYGMGGSYTPKSLRDPDDDWNMHDGWVSSSNC